MMAGDVLLIELFYRYGYKGAEMVAARAPFSMRSETEMIGRKISVDGLTFVVKGVGRQISGPLQEGEPLGLEINLFEFPADQEN
jgi:hypothetical protein